MPPISARRRAALAAAGVMLTALAAQLPGSASATPETRTPGPSSTGATTHQATAHTVTLLTGDRVTVTTAADGKVTGPSA
ncbi:hypothetical protein ACIPSA_14485 [Streptomyces sp. NPDC086549]|uniref:hypothetical protein n=1 Tax=Streptomyces sp. NPDC086549 TaxID=3365752 RepID=UPI003811223E